MFQNPFRILIIEDDPETCANLSDILELNGYLVDVAHSVAAAVDRSNWDEYLAIILDWKLPDGNAEVLLPMLNDLAPHAAVIVETGAVGLDGAVIAMRHGAVDYIVKPIDPNALLISIRRIAERQRLRMEKERSENVFRKLVESASSLIAILRLDRTIVYWNPYAARMTGYSAEDVCGRDFVLLFIPETEQPNCQIQMRQVVNGMPMQGHETQLQCRNGEVRWIVCNAQFLDDYDGDAAILAIGQDVTENKKTEERLLQTERLAAMGRAMTGLAHESRNALQRSQAGLEMLARRVQDVPEAPELISRIQKAQDDLHQLYEEVRKYAAPLRLKRSSVNLAEILSAEWDHLAILRQGRVTALEIEENGVNLLCEVDHFALRQCFRNVLENSLAACRDPVEIRACFSDAAIQGKPALKVVIADNGQGLTPIQKARIFEEFFTTKTQGTGLGMAICKRFVEAHGGQIEAGGVENSGAEICITLPRSAA